MRTLTGNICYRQNWRRKIILQVEFWSRANRNLTPMRVVRDATWEDLLLLERGKFSEECPPLRPPLTSPTATVNLTRGEYYERKS